MGAILIDTFKGADNTVLTAHPMDKGPGWEIISGTDDHIIVGNACRPPTLTLSGNIADAKTPNCVVRWEVTTPSSLFLVNLVARCQDFENMWYIRYNNGWETIELIGDVAVKTVRGSPANDSGLYAGRHVAELILSNNTMQFRIDGKTKIGYVGGSILNTNTKHGMFQTAGVGTPTFINSFRVDAIPDGKSF